MYALSLFRCSAQPNHIRCISRSAIEAATTLGDADTADLFTEISRGVDKLLWKVEAHAQGKD